MQFEFYVLNYDCNSKRVVNFNIFNNSEVQRCAENEVKKYLRSPKNYKKIIQYKNEFLDREEIAIYGWEAFVKEIDSIISWQEWSRCEYEISVSDAFTYEIHDIVRDLDKYDTLEKLKEELITQDKRNTKLEKWDCYMQAHANIETICYEIIRQYKRSIKNGKID